MHEVQLLSQIKASQCRHLRADKEDRKGREDGGWGCEARKACGRCRPSPRRALATQIGVARGRRDNLFRPREKGEGGEEGGGLIRRRPPSWRPLWGAADYRHRGSDRTKSKAVCSQRAKIDPNPGLEHVAKWRPKLALKRTCGRGCARTGPFGLPWTATAPPPEGLRTSGGRRCEKITSNVWVLLPLISHNHYA